MNPVAMDRSGRRLLANIAANYVGKLWTVAAIYLFVPFYVEILGLPAYGLIAFHTVALTILFVADAGLSAAFSRQAARESRSDALLDQLTSVEIVLLAALACGGLVMFIAAPYIASNWLDASGALPFDTTLHCLRLMPIALVPHVAISLYVGGLMGRQRQVAANAWQTAFTTMRLAAVLGPLYWRPDVTTFFVWQVVCGWSFFFLVRHALHHEITGGSMGRRGHFSVDSLRVVGTYAMGMFAMAFISGLNTQMDRLVVSRLRPLEDFALYTLAATLAQVPTMVTVPVSAALLPRLTQLAEAKDRPGLMRLYESSTYAVASFAASSAAVVVLFAPEILSLWLPRQTIPQSLPVVVTLLGAGGFFLALQLMPFNLSLAHGHSATNVKLGAITLMVVVPMQVVFTMNHGLIGAAVPWLLTGLVGFAFLGVSLNRRFGAGPQTTWFLRLNLIPATLCIAPIAAARAAADHWAMSPLSACMAAVMAAAAGLALVFLARPSAPSAA